MIGALEEGTTKRGHGRGRGKSTRNLSKSREANYGIPSHQPAVCSTGRIRATIDYLALNDGLEEDTPPSPKKKKRVTHRPKGGPSSTRIAAQKSMSSPESSQRSPLVSPVPSTALSGISVDDTTPLSQEADPPATSTSLTGIPKNDGHAKLTSNVSAASLSGVPSLSTDDQRLPDLVLDSSMADNVSNTPTVNASLESEQDLEVANVLLSLHDDIRDNTQDEEDDNATLMPIGGSGAPVDVAPQQIKLDQPTVDAAIANLVQDELNQEQPDQDQPAPAPAPAEQQTTEKTPQTLDPLASRR